MCCSLAAEIAKKTSFSKRNGSSLSKMENYSCLRPSQEIRLETKEKQMSLQSNGIISVGSTQCLRVQLLLKLDSEKRVYKSNSLRTFIHLSKVKSAVSVRLVIKTQLRSFSVLNGNFWFKFCDLSMYRTPSILTLRVNPLNLNIHSEILHTDLYMFP